MKSLWREVLAVDFAPNGIMWRGSPRPMLPPIFETDEHNSAAVQALGLARGSRGLVVVGPVGVGKSTLLAEIDFWTSLRPRPDGAPVTSSLRVAGKINAWTSAKEFVKSSWRWSYDLGSREKQGAHSPMELATRAYRLFLDDLGVEKGAQLSDRPRPATELIVELLSARFDHGRPTWISTNLEPREMASIYGERVMSRLRSTCEFVRLGGGDRRVPIRRRPAAVGANA